MKSALNFITKDLNLLRIFHVLWQERNVSRSAAILGLSQPAISNALARMRVEFDDPLFVRSSKGIVPTPLAESIHIQVGQILEEASKLYDFKQNFDPFTSERTVSIRANDYVEQLILPHLLQIMEEEALA